MTDINFDLYPRILNMQTCLPAITTTLKLPASTAGKGCSEDTFAGAGLCQKLHACLSPSFTSYLLHVVGFIVVTSPSNVPTVLLVLQAKQAIRMHVTGWISIKEFHACSDIRYRVPSMEISAVSQ